MASEKTFAIVLRVIEFSETSYITTLYTEDFGKIAALAKGARRRKSPFESALDLLAICRIVFIHKQSESLDLLTEAKLERRFRAGARDLKALYAGYYVLELLDQCTDPGDAAPRLFAAARATIESLDAGRPPRLWVSWFEAQLLQQIGSFPELSSCVECGREVLGPTVAFGLVAGGVLCERCKQGQRHLLRLSRKTLNLWRRLAEVTEPEELIQADTPQLDWQRVISAEFRASMNQYWANLLGHRPRMHSYLGTLIG